MERDQVITMFGLACRLMHFVAAMGARVEPAVPNPARRFDWIFFALALWLGQALGASAHTPFSPNIGPHTLTATAVHPSRLYTNTSTTTFTNQAVDQTVLTYYAEGQLTQRVWKSSAGQTNRTQNFKWDAKGRLLNFSERDVNNHGHDWTAVYDALGRRWQARTVPITNNVSVASQLKVVTQLYDPLVEFLEVGVRVDERWQWKVYGPDLDGVYGGLNGVGGWEAVVGGPDTYHTLLPDARGNIVAAHDPENGSLHWNVARITGYGSVAERRPLSLGEGAPMWEAGSWRGRFPEMSGLYNLGARYYDPVAGRFLSPDPLGHDSDPSLYGAFNGDPINYFDADGRFGKQALNSATGIDLNHPMPFSEQLLAYRRGGQEVVGPVVDFAWNLGVASVSPMPPAYSPAELRGIQSVGIEQFGSPMQKLTGYEPVGLVTTGPLELAGPLQNLVMARGAQGNRSFAVTGGVQARNPGRGRTATQMEFQFDAKPANMPLTPSAFARGQQGSGLYPGVDRFRDITLRKGTIIYGGEPGQSAFYTTGSAIRRAGDSATGIFQGLQVAPHPVHSYRPAMTAYEVMADIPAAFGRTLANPQNGVGGFPQIVIPNWQRALRPIHTEILSP